MAPPEHDDEPTTSELSEATEQFLTDTWATCDWLNQNLQQPDGSTTSVGWLTWERDGLDVTKASIDELWVLILTGTSDECLAARHELRERMVDGSSADIEARVPSIRAANLQEARDYMAELQAEAA
tara:strand:- start:179 stop:556 length:378 start_codon:yes stop_codon:yes gene_type:complete